jgi:MFS transporter, DHA2 family, multidrug resistance protein
MASASTTGPVPLSDRLRAFASALPADLSHSPLLGIAGVIMGAGIVTLAGRLLSLGLADLKGNVGIAFDDGAWLASAFNVALMFIGPLTVYLGPVLGARRVLLFSSVVFALVSLGLPFVHSYSLLICLLAIAGLTSGTFYPLTLSFVISNIPFRYLAPAMALYATSVEGGMNFAPSLYGFCRDHLSWAWMFWTCALVTPVMTACVYYGIRATPRKQQSGQRPSFAGFLYASAGFALLYAALDQGERLDWWRSGLFTALFTTGMFFLVCAAVRRLRAPNPFVDMPYLRQWNTVVLAGGLFAFRFCLLATIVVIPQTLSVRGLDAAQFGPAVMWTAVAELCVAFVAGYLLNQGLDSRLVMASGFAMIAFACLMNVSLTSAWAAENYFRSELLMAFGQAFAYVGVVSTLVLQSLSSGGLDSPYRVLTFSASIHTVRLFGGHVGATLMGHFIAHQEKLHSYLVGLHVQPGGWIAERTLTGVTAGLVAKSSGVAAAAGRSVGLVGSGIRLQAYTLSFIDAFQLIAWVSVVALIAIATVRRLPLNYRDLSAFSRSTASPAREGS